MIDPAFSFQDALDAVGRLSLDEQRTVIHILQKRVAERDRLRIVTDVADGRREFEEGRCRPVSVRSIVDEVDREP